MTWETKEQNNASPDLAATLNIRCPAAKGATLNMTRQSTSAANNRLGTVRAQITQQLCEEGPHFWEPADKYIRGLDTQRTL